MKKYTPVSYAVMVILATARAGGAYAADAEEPAASDEGIQDVIVTAQRRSESIQNVPITIQAITSESMALSLARAGRRTVLVDFDLRRPSFDEVFGLPLDPGVCEALRQQSAVSALVHPIATDNMAVVTAGRWDRAALASLSNGAAAAMFKELRDDFDFVVVDTSPILPVADARFVSQHVDSVVLSVFRDISEAPKIQAACEILSAFGVHTIEAVVTGPNDNLYGKHVGYEAAISA